MIDTKKSKKQATNSKMEDEKKKNKQNPSVPEKSLETPSFLIPQANLPPTIPFIPKELQEGYKTSMKPKKPIETNRSQEVKGVTRSALYKVLDDAEDDEKTKKQDLEVMKTQDSENNPAKKFKSLDKTQSVEVNDQRSVLQLTRASNFGVTRTGETIHPLAPQQIDADMIGRTGMYLERHGMRPNQKKSFDWIAYNRHNYSKNSELLPHHLGIALADVGVQKKLFLKTAEKLVVDGQITVDELGRIKKKMCKSKDIITISTAAWILKDTCSSYKRK